MAKFEASELTLDKNGNVYHLGIAPENIAETIILVGDQDRVKFIGEQFDKIEFEHQNREFCTLTGIFKGKRLSVMSTGIGTDNIDIVLNELDALVNIDLKSRTVKDKLTTLKLIRIGTCGSLQENVPPGSHIISRYAVGLDGVAGFYDIDFTQEEKNGTNEFISKTNWSQQLNPPYLAAASESLFNQLKNGMVEGITVTANGFYGPQGRALRIPLGVPDFKEAVRKFSFNGFPVTNLEMETSALYALSRGLKHEAVTICLVLANRYTNSFEPNYTNKMAELVKVVLNRI